MNSCQCCSICVMKGWLLGSCMLCPSLCKRCACGEGAHTPSPYVLARLGMQATRLSRHGRPYVRQALSNKSSPHWHGQYCVVRLTLWLRAMLTGLLFKIGSFWSSKTSCLLLHTPRDSNPWGKRFSNLAFSATADTMRVLRCKLSISTCSQTDNSIPCSQSSLAVVLS